MFNDIMEQFEKISPDALKGSDMECLDTFKWRSNGGAFYAVDNMSTNHLYYVLTVIWNRIVPSKLVPYKPFEFTDFYDNKYLESAIKYMLPELMTRDTTLKQNEDLHFMLDYLKTHQPDGTEIEYIKSV